MKITTLLLTLLSSSTSGSLLRASYSKNHRKLQDTSEAPQIVIPGTDITTDPLWEEWSDEVSTLRQEENDPALPTTEEEGKGPDAGVESLEFELEGVENLDDPLLFLSEEEKMIELEHASKAGKADGEGQDTTRNLSINKKQNSRVLSSSVSEWISGEQIIIFDDAFATPCDGGAIREFLVGNIPSSTSEAQALSYLASSLGTTTSTNDIDVALSTLCNNATPLPTNTNSFGTVLNKGYQFDNNYFNGGTSFNHGLASKSIKKDAWRVDTIIRSALHTTPINLPSYLPAFEGQCDASNTVYCCMIHEMISQGDGTVFHPITEVDSNANICSHDIAQSSVSARVANGFGIYHDGRTLDDASVPDDDAYCVGFTWNHATSATTPPASNFLGNALLDISLIGSLLDKNLAGNVPGAPLCGCAEYMPIVTNAACRESVDATAFIFKNASAVAQKAVDFRDCASNLSTHVGTIQTEQSVKDLVSSKLAGEVSCTSAVHNELSKSSQLSPYAYRIGTAWWYADKSSWSPLVGKGDLYHPDVGSSTFDRLWNKAVVSSSLSSSTSFPIVRRVCKSCTKSHQDIYYVRLTPLPPTLDFYSMLKNSFTNEHNVMGVDFYLYSSFEDAKANDTTKAWTYCDYSNFHGFPFECGPNGKVERQWTSFEYSGSYAEDMALYLEKAVIV